MTSYTAEAIVFACDSRPKCRSSIVAERTIAEGLALFLPWISCASVIFPATQSKLDRFGTACAIRWRRGSQGKNIAGTHLSDVSASWFEKSVFTTEVAARDDTWSTDERSPDVLGDVTVH
jgi:hypothetical protein